MTTGTRKRSKEQEAARKNQKILTRKLTLPRQASCITSMTRPEMLFGGQFRFIHQRSLSYVGKTSLLRSVSSFINQGTDNRLILREHVRKAIT